MELDEWKIGDVECTSFMIEASSEQETLSSCIACGAVHGNDVGHLFNVAKTPNRDGLFEAWEVRCTWNHTSFLNHRWCDIVDRDAILT